MESRRLGMLVVCMDSSLSIKAEGVVTASMPANSLFATVVLRCHDTLFAAYRFDANDVLFAYELGSKQHTSTSRVHKRYFPIFP